MSELNSRRHPEPSPRGGGVPFHIFCMTSSLSAYERIIPDGAKLCAMQQLSFSDEAARMVQATAPGATIDYADDIEGVWRAVEAGQHYGMIPFENSAKGVVWKHFDRLRQSNARILGEVHLHVRMCMGGLLGAKPDEATHVHSHPVGLAQCNRRLDELGIDVARRMRTKATPDGPRIVAEMRDPKHICLASRLAIEDQGLAVLEDEETVANHGSANITQFFVVHRNGKVELPAKENEYHGLIVVPDYERIGVLHDTLGILRDGRVDLHSLHSQRLNNGGEGYRFFMEMESGGDPDLFDIMRRKLQNCSAVRDAQWLGSWNGRLYSDSIRTVDPPYRSPHARPQIEGDTLDPAKRYHALQFRPDNYPGVLFDTTGYIRTSDVNLKFVHSRPEGHKQYGFLMGMDSGHTTPERFQLMLDHMRCDSHLQYVRWIRSTDAPEELRSLEPADD